MAQKKSFKADLNPAMQFISTVAEESTTAEIRANAPEGFKPNPIYLETRSKRVQVLMQPSLYEKLKAKAEREGCSVNDTIHRIFEEATREEN